MAVYTHLGAEKLAELISQYDVGELVSAKGIAEGVSNSNWLIETTGQDGNGAQFILTMYERRTKPEDLPYFLSLLDHLSAKGSPVPRTIHDRKGAAYRMLDGKAVALIEFLPGISIDRPNEAQARNVGSALAQMHLRAKDFEPSRGNDLGVRTSARVLQDCGDAALAEIDPALPAFIGVSQAVADQYPRNLPQSVIHSDLFPDNVLILGDDVSAMIDFYFACNDAMAYDVAVTHAAWSFDASGNDFRPDIGQALMEGYQSVRSLDQNERQAMPILAKAAALRFISSRAQDWIETPADALVTRKNPMDFVKRFEFYADAGENVFA